MHWDLRNPIFHPLPDSVSSFPRYDKPIKNLSRYSGVAIADSRHRHDAQPEGMLQALSKAFNTTAVLCCPSYTHTHLQ